MGGCEALHNRPPDYNDDSYFVAGKLMAGKCFNFSALITGWISLRWPWHIAKK
jgi:hypothetical protein